MSGADGHWLFVFPGVLCGLAHFILIVRVFFSPFGDEEMETEKWGVIRPRLSGGERQSQGQGLNSHRRRIQKGRAALAKSPGETEYTNPLFS